MCGLYGREKKDKYGNTVISKLDEEGMRLTGKMPNNQVPNEMITPSQNQAPSAINNQMNNMPVANQIQNPNVMPNIQPPVTPVENNNSIEQPVVNNNQQEIEQVSNEQPVTVDETETLVEAPKTENIFDKLRVKPEQIEQEAEESKLDLSHIVPEQAVSNITEQSVNQEPKPEYNNIYDIRFAINNFRQAIQNTEKFGFKVNTKEEEEQDKYKIIIEIDKNQNISNIN